VLSFWENRVSVYALWQQINGQTKRWIAAMRKAASTLSRGRPCGGKIGGSDESRGSNGRFSTNLATTRKSTSPRNVGAYRNEFSKKIVYGSYAPQNPKIEGSNGHLTPTSLKPGREILFSLRCSPRPDRSTFCTTYSFGATGRQIPQFSHFCLFFHTKRLKGTLRWPAYSPGPRFSKVPKIFLSFS